MTFDPPPQSGPDTRPSARPRVQLGAHSGLHPGSELVQDYLERSGSTPGRPEVALVCSASRRATGGGRSASDLRGAPRRARTRSPARSTRRGVERGDRVIVAGTTLETVVAFWAVLKADAVVSIVNPLTKSEKLSCLIGDCRPKALIADAHLIAVFTPAVVGSPHVTTVVVSGAIDDARLSALPGGVRFETALAEGDRSVSPQRRNLDTDLAAIVYTSGSTGDRRGHAHPPQHAHRRDVGVELPRALRRTTSSSTCCPSRSTTGSIR